MSTDEKQIEAFLKDNMPSLEELAPEEYEQLMGAYRKIQDKYSSRAQELLKEKGFEEEGDIKAMYAPGAAVVGGVIVVNIAAEAYDKYTGGEKTGG